MIQKMNFEQFKPPVISGDYQAIVCAHFLERAVVESLEQNLARFLASPYAQCINGPFGAAYERLTSRYVDLSQRDHSGTGLSVLEHRIKELRTVQDANLVNSFAVVRFNTLDGMTAHRDYSYNKDHLGTFVLGGKVVFGVGESRDAAYLNTVVLVPGDYIAVRAMRNTSDIRPYFCLFSLEESLVVRSWIRDKKDSEMAGGKK